MPKTYHVMLPGSNSTCNARLALIWQIGRTRRRGNHAGFKSQRRTYRNSADRARHARRGCSPCVALGSRGHASGGSCSGLFAWSPRNKHPIDPSCVRPRALYVDERARSTGRAFSFNSIDRSRKPAQRHRNAYANRIGARQARVRDTEHFRKANPPKILGRRDRSVPPRDRRLFGGNVTCARS
jgi:hypothetical protein